MQHPIAVKFKKSPLIATGIKIDPDTWIIKRFAFTPSLTYCPIYCLFKTKFHSRKVLAYVNKYRFKARYLHESANQFQGKCACMFQQSHSKTRFLHVNKPFQGSCMSVKQFHGKVLACVSKPISRCLHVSANPFLGACMSQQTHFKVRWLDVSASHLGVGFHTMTATFCCIKTCITMNTNK